MGFHHVSIKGPRHLGVLPTRMENSEIQRGCRNASSATQGGLWFQVHLKTSKKPSPMLGGASSLPRGSLCPNMCCVCQSLSHAQLFATPWTLALQAPLSMGFPREEYWSGLPFPSSGDLPDPGIKPTSPVTPALQVDSLVTEPSGKP